MIIYIIIIDVRNNNYLLLNLKNNDRIITINEEEVIVIENQDEIDEQKKKYYNFISYISKTGNVLIPYNKKDTIYIIEGYRIYDYFSKDVIYNGSNIYDLIRYCANSQITIPNENQQIFIDKLIEEIKQIIIDRENFIDIIAKEVFGDNYYFNKEGKYIVFLFPEIIIQNSQKQSHTIKELYIIITFKNNYLIKDILGTRGQINSQEKRNDYLHSHLNRYEGSFCLGASLIRELKYELREEFNNESFESLIYHLESLAEWESLEGTPYRRIRDIKPINNYEYLSTYSTSNLQFKIETLLNYIKNKYKNISIDNFISSKKRNGILYQDFTLSNINNELLYELGIAKVVINNNYEYLYSHFISNIIINDSNSQINRKKLHISNEYKYKDEYITTYLDDSSIKKNNIKQEDVQGVPSKKEIELIENYINNLVYGI